MATLLFRLNNVPEDEAEDVRQLLDDRGWHSMKLRPVFLDLVWPLSGW